MNRSSNVLNGALLGSAGKNTRIFLSADQTCEAVVTSRLSAVRKIRSTNFAAEATSVAKLRAGRYMKASLDSEAAIQARLTRARGVRLSCSLQATATI